jgi:DNA topoisomerase-1
MGRSLVIVESPAKAKTINKYLGREFVVKSSYGHIRDLPVGAVESSDGEGKDEQAKAKAALLKSAAKGKKGKKVAKAAMTETGRVARNKSNLIRRMGVDPEHGWKADYRVLPGKEKVLEELRGFAEDADTIYLASDLDREGEAIAWHLREAIGGDHAKYKRVVFSEITKAAIQTAFKSPGKINMDRVHAQQARRFLDRVVGFMVSPLLWEKIARGLSAGRVQSVATRLIVEREREIRAFVPVEYWELHADLQAKAAAFRAEVVRFRGAPFKPTTKAHADAAVAALSGAGYVVSARDDKPHRTHPGAPFITSTLQQGASTRLSFSVKKTMTLAQRLYEAGHITYMRTDSVNLSADAVTACRALVSSRFGQRYVPEKPNTYQSKANAQEAHEAIRPTDVALDAGELTVDEDERRLYDLIWRQFVACQMTSAEYDTTAITVSADEYELHARGRVMRFDGFLKVLPPAKQDEPVLPELTSGEKLKLIKLDPTQHFTKPPPRFSEAGLVRELEKKGIGRPSTYAAIISTIQDRGYAKLANRRFYAEKLGDIVTSRLQDSFPDLMDYGFTAGMEGHLDQIAEAQAEWKGVLDDFYRDFTGKLKLAGQRMRPNDPVTIEILCPKCSRPMAIRTGRTGVFLGCTGYNLPKAERCTSTMNLVPGEESVTVASDEAEDQATEVDVSALLQKRRCQICGTAMDAYLVDEKRKLHICGNNPDCPGSQVEFGQFKIKGYEGPQIDCDKCGAKMQLRTGRFGKYFACTRYPECVNTRKLLRSGEAAPPKIAPVHMRELKCTKSDGYFVLRDGAAGLFLASSAYPRSRETRPPQVEDLVRHKAELDPKYHYLTEAPLKDPKGNPTLIRFARKTKEHFLSSEKDDEPTGWTAMLIDGAWVEKAVEGTERRGRKPAKTVKPEKLEKKPR